MESLRELYRIGYGPSSSHTMGPFRASDMFLEKCGDAVYYTAHLYGSLALTGKGHFTDKAIEKCFKEHGRDVHVEFHPDKSLPLHPNAMTIVAYDKENKKPVIRASICNGEQVAGFKDKQTGHFTEVCLIRNAKELEAFQQRYGIDDVTKEY